MSSRGHAVLLEIRSFREKKLAWAGSQGSLSYALLEPKGRDGVPWVSSLHGPSLGEGVA